MRKTKHNEGFSLVELLVSIAILSIIMLMIVQFMSTSTAADRKTKYNLKAQTAANELLNGLAENLSKASYVRVVPAESTVYEMPAATRISEGEVVASTKKPTSDTSGFSFHLVVDDYGEYVRYWRDTDTAADKRDSIVDLNTFKLAGKRKNSYYPLSGDLEGLIAQDIRSFRCMKQDDGTMLYVKPAYIYMEFIDRIIKDDGTIEDKEKMLIYKFNYDTNSVYVYKSWAVHNSPNKYLAAIGNVDGKSGTDGLVMDNLDDFYLSCDAKGEAFYLDTLVDVKGYKFNGKSVVSLRNSHVLTAPPERARFMKNNVAVDENGDPVVDGGE